ncbi:MAG: carboxylating nicotinate-nucleotide diphosphorylase [Gammaproteobacteria bacterium]|nr:carboxylating nicotinate-nucleotide diphosphorylase [Gammaproteobacteria bacterium]
MRRMSAVTSPPLPDDIDATVSNALREDVGAGDVTASLIPAARVSRAHVLCREAAVLAGAPWFDGVFRQLDARVTVEWLVGEGSAVSPDTVVCRLHGPARALVTGERTALNFLQTLSGTATTTRRYVDALGATRTRILDTRKTLPGLRAAQKYAVRAGGGVNHRMGLYDAILIKENHIAAAGSITAAVTALRASHPGLRIEVEIETRAELEEALANGVEMVLLDNFSLDELREATAYIAGRALVEISGGVELPALAALGQAGADFISIGALTKHVRAVDFSMRIDE